MESVERRYGTKYILCNNAGLFVKVPTMQRLRKICSPSADPKYSADHGPLPHISAGHVI